MTYCDWLAGISWPAVCGGDLCTRCTSANASGRVSEFQRDSVDEAILVEDDGHLAVDRFECCIDCRPRGE